MSKRVSALATIMVLFFGVNSLLFSEVDPKLGTFEMGVLSDNPYIDNANSLVEQSLKRYQDYAKKDVYSKSIFRSGTISWLAWGYGDKHSKHYGDTTYLNTAIRMMDVLFLSTKGEGFSLDGANQYLLPAYLLKKFGAPKSKVKEWAEKYVVPRGKSMDGKGNSYTANIAHSWCTMIEYCSQIVGDFPEWKEDAKSWSEQAKVVMKRVDKAVLPDGAYGYYAFAENKEHGFTGPAAFYDNINILNLMHYYFITGDSIAKHGITEMAKRYRVLPRSLNSETVSIPYWKAAIWNDRQWTGVSKTPIRFSAWLAEDTTVLALSMLRGKDMHVDNISFPLMYAWNRDLEPGEIPTKFTQYNGTTGGPILRHNRLSVYMTSHAKTATSIGIIYLDNPKDSVIDSITGKPVFTVHSFNPFHTQGVSLFMRRPNGKVLMDMPGPDMLENQGVIITPDWVAMGTIFSTCWGSIPGNGKPNGWVKSELWFADSSGFTGGSALDCNIEKESVFDGIYGNIKFNGTNNIGFDTANLIFSKSGLTFAVSGDSIIGIKKGVIRRNKSKDAGVSAIISNSGNRIYKPGEKFDLGVSVQAADSVIYKAPKYERVGNLFIRSFTRDGKRTYTIYNGSDSAVSWKPATAIKGNIWYSTEDKRAIVTPVVYNNKNVSIAPKQLVVVREGTPVSIKSTKSLSKVSMISYHNRKLLLSSSANVKRVMLFNARGAVISEFSNLEGQKELSLKDVRSGFYIVKAIQKDGVAISQKILVY